MSTNTHPCEDARRIERRRKVGASVREQDIRFLTSHIAACDCCKADIAVRRALQIEDAVEPLSEMDRRRLFDTVLARAASPEETTSAPEGVSRRRLGIFVAAASIAAVFVSFLLLDAPGRAPAPGAKDASSRPVSRDGSPPAGEASGARWSSVDGRIETAAEQSAVKLPTGIALLLGPATSVQIVRMDKEVIALDLSSGSVLASVDPKREGPTFTVTTNTLKAIVTGTVFYMTAGAAGDRLEVLRGRVRMVDAAGHRMRVSAGYTYSHDAGAGALSAVARRNIQAEMAHLERSLRADRSLVDLSGRLDDLARRDDPPSTPADAARYKPNGTTQIMSLWPKSTRIYRRHLRTAPRRCDLPSDPADPGRYKRNGTTRIMSPWPKTTRIYRRYLRAERRTMR